MTNTQTQVIQRIVRQALAEDIGDGDITTNATIPAKAKYRGIFLAKANGVISGLKVAELVFKLLDPKLRFKASIKDGDKVKVGDTFAEVNGAGRGILTGERVALNFLQRMGGIATLTSEYVKAVGTNRAKILDTRKTVPGLRILEKKAVRDGGGVNHRIGLYDMVLIKDNHIAAVGSITETVARVRRSDTRNRKIEVEVKNMEELREAIATRPDRILLDNMNLDQIKEAVKFTADRVPLEVSGGVTLETVGAIAATGVDFISSGALTHSVKALDISLELTPQ